MIGITAVKYFIDWLGRLWKGPGDCQNLHYALFHGYMAVAPHEQIWVYERTDPPEDASEVDWNTAQKAMRPFDPLTDV
jgi:hypothetical protein